MMDIHPIHSTLLLAKPNGKTTIYNYLTNEKKAEEKLQLDEEITALKYSNTGHLLAVGTKKGNLYIFDSKSYASKINGHFTFAKGTIKQVVFSPSDEYLACYDLDRCVTVYKYEEADWGILGRCRCHTKPITYI